MSKSTIDGKIRVLQQRLDNEKRICESGYGQAGIAGSRNGNNRRPRPPTTFAFKRDMLVFPPQSPQATETEHRMREVYKVSGKLNVDSQEYRSNVNDLHLLGDLGSGTCGHVVKMLHKPSGAVIAVKQMRRSGNSEDTKRILMDLDVVVRSHDCPYIVRCLGCFVTDSDVWICMELMETCFDKLLKRLAAPIPEAILGKVTVATVNALSYLKDTHGVIHRDVKPSNILLDARGNVKLCDFGISGRLVDSKAKTRSAGCAAYLAPERIDPPDPSRPDYDIRADVWSLGISLVELATGVFPYRNCQNDFEVLSKVITDDPPQLPDDSDFTPEFKSFVSQCLTKNYRYRPKYAKLLEHPFVVKSAKSTVSVESWYASLSAAEAGPPSPPAPPTPLRAAPASASAPASAPAPAPLNGLDPQPPTTPQPVRNFVTTSQYWPPEQITPTPQRARWGVAGMAAGAGPGAGGAGGSQPTSLEDYSGYSPYARRRTIETSASPPPPPVRRPSADSRWRPAASATSLTSASPASSGNTSPIVLQRFYHQSQQRRSRVDLHSTPRHRSLSREHSTGRSPEPPPRTSRQHPMLGHEANGDDPPPLHDRLHPPSPLLLNDRLSEGRSQSLTRAEIRNGFRTDVAPLPPSKLHHDDHGWLHSLAGLLKRRLSGYVNWSHVAARRDPLHHPHHLQHRWGHSNSETRSVPASPLPPRAPPPRPHH
ncbi:dual specificity mitogen-activated protein kinase kinase hemipterous-like [Achroia grisella]|uniref:dual specificity mitogen-activated protein kinase kinase hemipterous-like n=1 Tax=Achroia grisella TaxID=688607 RepID=UPI0027D218C6|nr:dual specificity mitogen-activated protein kinase kinase hemipterous-like [Achroia grisella]